MTPDKILAMAIHDPGDTERDNDNLVNGVDVVGDMSRRQQSVRRGTLSLDPGFSQFYFADGLLQAVLCINGDPALLQAARERITERRPVTHPEACAEEGRDLASL